MLLLNPILLKLLKSLTWSIQSVTKYSAFKSFSFY